MFPFEVPCHTGPAVMAHHILPNTHVDFPVSEVNDSLPGIQPQPEVENLMKRSQLTSLLEQYGHQYYWAEEASDEEKRQRCLAAKLRIEDRIWEAIQK